MKFTIRFCLRTTCTKWGEEVSSSFFFTPSSRGSYYAVVKKHRKHCRNTEIKKVTRDSPYNKEFTITRPTSHEKNPNIIM